MTIAATTILLEAVKTAADAGTAGVAWFISRDLEEQPLNTDAGEVPGGVFRMLNVTRIPGDMHGAWRWSGTLQADVYGGGTADKTIDEQTAAIIADTIAALWGDDEGTLGGLVELLEPEVIDASEQATPDVGWALLQWNVVFYTTMGSFASIVSLT